MLAFRLFYFSRLRTHFAWLNLLNWETALQIPAQWFPCKHSGLLCFQFYFSIKFKGIWASVLTSASTSDNFVTFFIIDYNDVTTSIPVQRRYVNVINTTELYARKDQSTKCFEAFTEGYVVKVSLLKSVYYSNNCIVRLPYTWYCRQDFML